MSVGDQILTFVITSLATLGVVIPSVCAFSVAGFLSEILTNDGWVAQLVGVVAALGCGVGMTIAFVRVNREGRVRRRENRYR